MEAPRSPIFTNDHNTIMHNTTPSNKMLSCHMHSHNELLFIVSGDVRLENNTGTLDVHAPVAIFHNSYTMHRANTVSDAVYERYIVNFDDELIERYTWISDGLRFFKNANMTVISLTEKMADTLKFYFTRYENMDTDAAKNHLSALIIYELYKYRSDENTRGVSAHLPYINSLMYYIALNYASPLTLETLAAMSFISRAKLVADFKQSTGMTVKRYIKLVRLNNARSFLQHGNSVAVTAAYCGYNSESNFITAFGNMFGINPGEYVRNCREFREAVRTEAGEVYQIL